MLMKEGGHSQQVYKYLYLVTELACREYVE